ncbi:MAG: cytochrome c peroxidase [Planctomycetaceae bacterium]
MSRPFLVVLLLSCCWVEMLQAADQLMKVSALRRPVAIEHAPDLNKLLILNQRSASLSFFDLSTRQVTNELAIGGKPTDMELIPETNLLAITNEAKHTVRLYKVGNDKLDALADIEVCSYPRHLKYDVRQSLLYVSGMWSRQLAVVQVDTDIPSRSDLLQKVDMEFTPHNIVFMPDEKHMVVGDCFGGNLMLFDTTAAADGKLKQVGLRVFPGHNVRGLQISADGEMLIVAHQMLNELAHTVRNDVHWGLLMSNDLRWLKVDSVLRGGDELYTGAHMHPLGEAGNATGDPSQVAVSSDGTVVVTLGGVGEIAYGKEDDFSLQRLKVGLRPVDLVIDETNGLVYVANMFSDSVSVVDLKRQSSDEIPLGSQVALTERDKGELLFFNAKLSHDGWMSCNSCHTEGHTNGMVNDNFSDKSFGAPKRVFSLLGKAGTEPFAWNGQAQNLQKQIHNSLRITMQMDEEPTEQQLNQIAVFVSSLKRPPSIDVARGKVDAQAIERGRQVFMTHQCKNCHAPPTYTVAELFDVGLVDKEGNKEFNPPTLIGVGQRVHFFHDNSAKTLESVFKEHAHPAGNFGGNHLTDSQISDLVAFLKSL